MTAKGKHLTQEDRQYIEDALNESYRLSSLQKSTLSIQYNATDGCHISSPIMKVY